MLTTAGVVAGVLLARASTFTLTGAITVSDPADSGVLGVSSSDITSVGNGACETSGGYSDIQQGTTVVVSDASGKTIALGELTGEGQASGVYTCRFAFRVPNVPEGKGFYGVEISHRGVVKMTEREAHQPVLLQLGN